MTVNVNNITEVSGFVSSRVTFWGVPGDPRHDSVRGWNCLNPVEGRAAAVCSVGGGSSAAAVDAADVVHGAGAHDAWKRTPGRKRACSPPRWNTPSRTKLGRPVGLDGCNQLPFSPSLEVAPDGQAASTPTGLSVGVHVPQERWAHAEGLAPGQREGHDRDAARRGAIEPRRRGRAAACSEAQIALEQPGCVVVSGSVEGRDGGDHDAAVAEPVEGGVYLANRTTTRSGASSALYVVAQNPKSGVVIKLAGEVALNPVTGQLVATFPNEPGAAVRRIQPALLRG